MNCKANKSSPKLFVSGSFIISKRNGIKTDIPTRSYSWKSTWAKQVSSQILLKYLIFTSGSQELKILMETPYFLLHMEPSVQIVLCVCVDYEPRKRILLGSGGTCL